MNFRASCLVVAGCLELVAAGGVQEFRLPNGLQVILVENHERPLVRLELRTAWDASEEPRGKEGVGGFLGDMLRTSGAGLLKRDAFQRFLEDRALRYSFSMNSRTFAWSVLSDSQGQDDAFESLAMAATRSSFDGPAVEARRRIYIRTLKERTPREQAEALFLSRIEDSSRRPIPKEGSLNRIEFQDLVQLSRRVIRPERSVLVIHGDMSLPQARQMAVLHLGAWGPGPESPLAPAREAVPDQPAPTRTWLIVDAGKAVQVRVGAPVPAMSGPMLMTCAWLAKRELRAGLPSPLAQADLQISPEGAWLIKTVASPGSSAPDVLEAVQLLLKRLRGESLGSVDLEAARAVWATERGNRGLHPQQEAAFLADCALTAGRPEMNGDTFRVEGLQAALRRMFPMEACCYFIQGPVPQDAEWLVRRGLGPVETLR